MTSTETSELVDPAVLADTAPPPPVDAAALRAEIELTRAGLADTVEALAAKLDVKAQVGSAVSNAKERVRAGTDRMTGRAARARRRNAAAVDPYASAGGDPTGIDLTLEAAVDRRRRDTRVQSIFVAGAAGLLLAAVTVWAMRRNHR